MKRIVIGCCTLSLAHLIGCAQTQRDFTGADAAATAADPLSAVSADNDAPTEGQSEQPSATSGTSGPPLSTGASTLDPANSDTTDSATTNPDPTNSSTADADAAANDTSSETVGTGASTGGSSTTDDGGPVLGCEEVQCLRAFTCAETCDGPIVQSGCCPCPDGTIDTGVECNDPNEPVACGARAGNSCSDKEYCAYEPGQLCGQADAEATCKPRPEVCTDDYTPVCGCDGQTYSNACSAAAKGTGVYETGACKTKPDCQLVECLRAVECAESCGGKIVQSGCCPCPEGTIDTAIECTSNSERICGGFAGNTCLDSEYCAYEPGQLCGAADASSTCKPRPQACTKQYDPVCGCDGKTYGNACDAASNGTGVAQTGECAASISL